jgi:hypothetical protein
MTMNGEDCVTLSRMNLLKPWNLKENFRKYLQKTKLQHPCLTYTRH